MLHLKNFPYNDLYAKLEKIHMTINNLRLSYKFIDIWKIFVFLKIRK